MICLVKITYKCMYKKYINYSRKIDQIQAWGKTTLNKRLYVSIQAIKASCNIKNWYKAVVEKPTSFGIAGLGGTHSLAMYFFCSYLARIKLSSGLKSYLMMFHVQINYNAQEKKILFLDRPLFLTYYIDYENI